MIGQGMAVDVATGDVELAIGAETNAENVGVGHGAGFLVGYARIDSAVAYAVELVEASFVEIAFVEAVFVEIASVVEVVEAVEAAGWEKSVDEAAGVEDGKVVGPEQKIAVVVVDAVDLVDVVGAAA